MTNRPQFIIINIEAFVGVVNLLNLLNRILEVTKSTDIFPFGDFWFLRTRSIAAKLSILAAASLGKGIFF